MAYRGESFTDEEVNDGFVEYGVNFVFVDAVFCVGSAGLLCGCYVEPDFFDGTVVKRSVKNQVHASFGGGGATGVESAPAFV
jgi:hypothetical protein